MNAMSVHETTSPVDDLRDHIQDRTFGRLHNLSVVSRSDGRIVVSAIAHSRFVGQLAEWAVLERVPPTDVDLSISVFLSSRQSMEDQK